MKAYKKLGNNIYEIEVDVDSNGNPLLPDNTTIEEKPEVLPGYYLDIVDNSWVQIPLPQEVLELDTLKSKLLCKLRVYKEWYLDQPVTYNNRPFDADEQAHIRLSQVLITYLASQYLPPVWIDYNNQDYVLNGYNDFMGLVTTVQQAFATRFYEMNELRKQIFAATTEQELNAINIPSIPT